MQTHNSCLDDRLQLDCLAHMLIWNDHIFHLTPTETKFLALLFENPYQVLPKTIILLSIWNDLSAEEALRTLVYRLRRKFGLQKNDNRYLVRLGEGYILCAEYYKPL